MSSTAAAGVRPKVQVSASGPVVTNRWRGNLLKYFVLIIGVIFALYPLAVIIGASFDPTNSLAGASLFPANPTLSNYAKILNPSSDAVLAAQGSVLTWLFNSIKISTLSTLITLALTTLAAYAFSRFRFRGRRNALLATLIIQVFPTVLALVAFYLLLQKLGTIIPWLGLDTHGGLILIYCGGALGANAWLMKGYFDTIPRDLDESAMVDGASQFTIFWRIILPLIRPILAVIGLLSFIGTFNDFLLPKVLLKTSDQYTLAVGLTNFLGNNSFTKDWGVFAAGALIGAGPIVVVFLILQTQFVSGLSAGAVKG